VERLVSLGMFHPCTFRACGPSPSLSKHVDTSTPSAGITARHEIPDFLLLLNYSLLGAEKVFAATFCPSTCSNVYEIFRRNYRSGV
jgi:hypothetical protein